VELVHHGVDGVLQLGDLAAHIDSHFLGEVAHGDSGGDLSDVADLGGEVAGHRVDAVGQVLPGAGDACGRGRGACSALGARVAGHAGHLACERVQLVDHRVDGVLQLEDLALHVHRHLLAQVAVGHRGGDLGDVADLGGEVAGHRVDAVGQVLP